MMSDGIVGNRSLSYQERPPEKPVDNDNDTLMVPPRTGGDEIPTLSPLSSVPQPGMMPGLVQVALFIPDRPAPVLVTDTEFVLGRITVNDRANIIDLSPYRGYLLGVSRHHVVIAQTSDGYLVKDLGSANGTWLNGGRLAPFVPYVLKDGDHLELGRLSLTIRFVFSGTAPH